MGKTYKKIMIGLDTTSMDATLIQYTAFLIPILKPEKIYFIHIHQNLDIPDELREELNEAFTPLDEQLEEQMKQTVAQNFPQHTQYDIDYELVEGSPQKELLRWTHIKDIDLLIMGRKETIQGDAVIPQQVSRSSTCSVLFVPEKITCKISRILTPSDFSQYSKQAFEHSLRWAKELNATLDFQYIYTVPQGYYKTGKTQKEFAKIMKGNAQKQYDQFIQDIDTQNVTIEQTYTLDPTKGNTAQLINQHAIDSTADFIIMGARGRTLLTSFFLGSTTEKLITLNSQTPLLVIKKKNEAFGILKMLDLV